MTPIQNSSSHLLKDLREENGVLSCQMSLLKFSIKESGCFQGNFIHRKSYYSRLNPSASCNLIGTASS